MRKGRLPGPWAMVAQKKYGGGSGRREELGLWRDAELAEHRDPKRSFIA